MPDMLVDLYKEHNTYDESSISETGIRIQRALSIDRAEVCKFVDDNFNNTCPGWVDECASTLYRHPASCFIAIKKKQILGFACYDGTAKGMVGPIGVAREYRRLGIARVLLNRCFEAMKMEGYAYAIIGWVSSTDFYEKACGAIALPENFPGIYSRMTMHN